MKKLLFLALFCLPIMAISQDKSGVPSKGRQTSSFTSVLNTGYDYAVLKVIENDDKNVFVGEKYDVQEDETVTLGKYSSLLQALSLLGNDGYEVIYVEDIKKNDKNVVREYLLMKEVPKKKPQMSERKK